MAKGHGLAPSNEVPQDEEEVHALWGIQDSKMEERTHRTDATLVGFASSMVAYGLKCHFDVFVKRLQNNQEVSSIQFDVRLLYYSKQIVIVFMLYPD